jgi:hypothetical protein
MVYISRLFRPRQLRTWGIVIAVCLLTGVGSALAAIYSHIPLLFLGTGLSLIALGVLSYILLREACWCEMHTEGLTIKNPFGEVTSLCFAALDAISVHRYGKEDWYILWDGRPLTHRVYGRRHQNHPRVAVRVPKTVEMETLLSRIPIPQEKQRDRDLLREALTSPECTFLWRDIVYEVTHTDYGHLALWAENDEDTVLIGRFLNADDLIRRARLSNTPLSALLAPSETFAMSKTLREDVVKCLSAAALESFASFRGLAALRELAAKSGHQIVVRKYLLRPSPTISYEGGLAVDVFDGEGKPLLINDEPLSHDLPCVVADEVGHLDLYPWEENRDFAVFLAVVKQILLIKTSQ